jgi:hypothetical protein
MGGGIYSRDAWAATSTARASMGESDIYKQSKLGRIHKDLDPRNIKVRESRDSQDSPQAVPVLLGCDGTGSMGKYALYLAKQGIGDLVTRLLDRRPIPYPHIGFMMIGDAIAGDQAPLQVSQLEADNRIDQVVEDFWIEKRGGGNSSESYDLPWYFAAKFVESDAWDKRQQKGYLITYGDEPAPHFKYGTRTLQRVFGDRVQGPVRTSQMLDMAQEKFRVFHVIIEEGSYGRSADTKRTWQKLLGPNALFLDDHKALPELVVATIAFAEGMALEEVLAGCGNHRASVERAFNISAAYDAQGDTSDLGREETDDDDL